MSPSARTIVALNIRRFRGLLETGEDPGKRETIQRLLAERERLLTALVKKEVR